MIDRHDQLTAELLDVFEFILDNHWHAMNADDRHRVLLTLMYVKDSLPKSRAPIVD